MKIDDIEAQEHMCVIVFGKIFGISGILECSIVYDELRETEKFFRALSKKKSLLISLFDAVISNSSSITALHSQ
jgi:hypothetical protein